MFYAAAHIGSLAAQVDGWDIGAVIRGALITTISGTKFSGAKINP